MRHEGKGTQVVLDQASLSTWAPRVSAMLAGDDSGNSVKENYIP